MKYAVVEIWCHKSDFNDKVYAGIEVMCTVNSRPQAEIEQKLFEARDGHQYVICQVKE